MQSTIMELQRAAGNIAEELQGIRCHFHRYPEVSRQEKNTAAFISRILTDWGIPHRTGVGGYGIVADLGCEDRQPVLALRADMDALPIEESTDEIGSCRSSIPGVAHLCGHDAHMTMLLGAAKLLRDLLEPGMHGVRLLFQPAEEVGGAVEFLKEGAIEGIQHVVALHIHNLPAGSFGIRSGVITASVDRFEAIIHGKGCHGASPHLGVDPVVIASGVVQALQTVISRGKSPLEPGVLTVGRLQVGSQYNIISESAVLEGTIRAYSQEVRSEIKRQAAKIIEEYPQVFGGRGEWRVDNGHGCVLNDPRLVSIARELIVAGWGNEAAVEIQPQTFGEDLALYGQSAQTLLVLVGAGEKAALHNPAFKIDETVLPIGASFMAGIALQLMHV